MDSGEIKNLTTGEEELKERTYTKQKSVSRCSIHEISLVLLLCAILVLHFITFYILVNQIDHLEVKIKATIKNIVNKESHSELISNTTNELIDKPTLGNNATEYITENYFKIINRTDWGAADSTGELIRLNGPIDIVIIAHTETHECNNFDTCKLQMNILQLFFTQLRNFEDIGYNFLIGGDGAVYEGIGWDYIGHHTRGHNDNSIGIGFIGNYQNKMPTDNQLSAATLLLNYGLENNYLNRNYVIKGQKDFLPIISPGKKIYDRIMKWGHFYKRN